MYPQRTIPTFRNVSISAGISNTSRRHSRKPPAESGTKDTGSPRSTGHKPASSAATTESSHPPSVAATAKPGAALSPELAATPSTQAAATPAPPPPPPPAKSALPKVPHPSPESAVQNHLHSTLSPHLVHLLHALLRSQPSPREHESCFQTASKHTPANPPTHP